MHLNLGLGNGRRKTMDELIYSVLIEFSTLILLIIIGVSLFILSKGADILVNEAVGLSLRWGVPKMIIGATIVSLGTTLPEMTVSVFAAINGNPDLALGNAIGSIITNAGLIIGLAALVGELPIDKRNVVRQSHLQLISSILLAFVSLSIFSKGSNGIITQWMGFIFLALLVIYIVGTIRYSKENNGEAASDFEEEKESLPLQLIRLGIGMVLVIFSSKILIPSVEIIAIRIGIPQSVVAATLVAFGTSLPELVTAIASVRKGHGELAVGNIIGANILNILFVIGSAAAVTKQGLLVPTNFYKLQIPTMLIVLLAFHIFIKNKDEAITKIEGVFLLVTYIVYLILNYI